MRSPASFLRFLLCALLCLGAACSRKPRETPLAAAQLFFDRIQKGDLKTAFESSSFQFQTQQNLKFFTERAREYGLSDAAVALSPISSDAESAKFRADLTTKRGGKYALNMTLHFEQGAWRVYSLRAPRNPATGISEDRFTIIGRSAALNIATSQRVPSDAEIRKLVNDSMLLFSDAILTESFAEFYDFASVAWQKELTEQKLKYAFQAFIDKQVDMTGIMRVQPIFDKPPEIGSDGYLGIVGHYPTKPFEVHFALRYIYELPEWKLLGLNAYLKKLGEEEKAAAPPGRTP